MIEKPPAKAAVTKFDYALACTLLALLIWLLWNIFSNVGGLFDAHGDYQALAAISGLIFHSWELAALIGMAYVTDNQMGWSNGRRLIVGSLALALLIGALSLAAIHEAASAIASLLFPSLALPGNVLPWWGFALAILLMLVLTPALLIAAGSSVILGVFASALALFGLLVGIPSMLFRQILELDIAVTRHKYEVRGLSGYIVRFMYWLRNEPIPAAPPDEAKGARFATQAEAIARHNADIEKPGLMYFGHGRTRRCPSPSIPTSMFWSWPRRAPARAWR